MSENNQLNFPVIMISGHATIETAVEATRLGAFDFIEKPLSIENLIASAEKALRTSAKTFGKEVVLLLKNNCNSYKNTFVALDGKLFCGGFGLAPARIIQPAKANDGKAITAPDIVSKTAHIEKFSH